MLLVEFDTRQHEHQNISEHVLMLDMYIYFWMGQYYSHCLFIKMSFSFREQQS